MDIYDYATQLFHKSMAEGLEALDEVEMTVYAIDWLEREVNNGGFDQYYYNSSGNQGHYVVGALKRIGAPATAELVAKANAEFGDDFPEDQLIREEIYFDLIENGNSIEVWNALDDIFFRYEENLGELLRDYVIEHGDPEIAAQLRSASD